MERHKSIRATVKGIRKQQSNKRASADKQARAIHLADKLPYATPAEYCEFARLVDKAGLEEESERLRKDDDAPKQAVGHLLAKAAAQKPDAVAAEIKALGGENALAAIVSSMLDPIERLLYGRNAKALHGPTDKELDQQARALAEQQKMVAESGKRTFANCGLDHKKRKILDWLSARPNGIFQHGTIAAGTEISCRAVGPLLNSLAAIGFVHYPNGPRSGCQITAAGLSAISAIPGAD